LGRDICRVNAACSDPRVDQLGSLAGNGDRKAGEETLLGLPGGLTLARNNGAA